MGQNCFDILTPDVPSEKAFTGLILQTAKDWSVYNYARLKYDSLKRFTWKKSKMAEGLSSIDELQRKIKGTLLASSEIIIKQKDILSFSYMAQKESISAFMPRVDNCTVLPGKKDVIKVNK